MWILPFFPKLVILLVFILFFCINCCCCCCCVWWFLLGVSSWCPNIKSRFLLHCAGHMSDTHDLTENRRNFETDRRRRQPGRTAAERDGRRNTAFSWYGLRRRRVETGSLRISAPFGDKLHPRFSASVSGPEPGRSEFGQSFAFTWAAACIVFSPGWKSRGERVYS